MSPAQVSQLAVGAGTAFCGLASLVWMGLSVPMLLGSRSIRGLGSVPTRVDDSLPSLTIVSASRDEASRVEHAARSLLGQEYPGLEIVFVDDRSTDGTGAILDRLAAADPRLRVLHVETLPPGWLGKCHALATASAAARSEWILFTDGDVWMAPDAARRAVALARELGADHLAVGADLEIHSLGERIFASYFSAMFYATQRPWKAPDPRSKAHIGIGAFNLVRRELYERSGGHHALRMEILDDLGLGLIVKRAGGSSHFANHDGLLSVRWHHGVRGLIRGVEKNAFAALRYRSGETIVSVTLQFLGSLAPVAGFFLPGSLPKLFSLVSWFGLWLLYRHIGRGIRIGRWDFLTAPIGAALFSYAILRSMVVTLRQGGVVWRDTRYGMGELKKGLVR
jgi:glycosyltransferase involved in cell wall biosynthesis